MLYTIVDLGSNTIRLCIYENKENKITSLYEKKTMAGLVNYIVNDKLCDKGIKKACEILNEYDQILENFKIGRQDVHVFATASLRNITNTKEVLDIIKEETGYSVELLTGEEEAILDFKGATRLLNHDTGLLIDIGGGSTEIVSFYKKEIIFAVSIPVGSLNLYVKYVKKIIPKPEEREEIKAYVLNQLKMLGLKKESYSNVCGVGGTMRAAAKLSCHMFKEGKALHGGENKFRVSEVKAILEAIKNSHKKTLKPVLQTIPDRIHTIVPGLLVLETIADYFNCEEVTISKYGIREGYLFEKILTNS